MTTEDQVRDALRARSRQVTPTSEGWSRIEGRLEDPSQPPLRETRRRVAAALVAFAVFGGAALFAWRALAPSGSLAPGVGAVCRSADEPGLITCDRALQLAHHEFGGGDIAGTTATLSSYQANPGVQAVRTWKVVYPNVESFSHGLGGCIIGDWSVVLDAHTGALLLEGSLGTQPGTPCPSPSPTVPHAQAVRVTVFPLGNGSKIPRGVVTVGDKQATFCIEEFAWTMPNGARVHRMAGTGRMDALPTCNLQSVALQVTAGTPITVSGSATTYLRATRTEAPLYPGIESVMVEAHWPEGVATFIVPLNVVVTASSPTQASLTCKGRDQIKFAAPKGFRIAPGGSAYIVGNLGIPQSDVVEQMTKSAGGAEWYGTWQVVRDGQVVALVNFPTLDGVACRGSGIGGA